MSDSNHSTLEPLEFVLLYPIINLSETNVTQVYNFIYSRVRSDVRGLRVRRPVERFGSEVEGNRTPGKGETTEEWDLEGKK